MNEQLQPCRCGEIGEIYFQTPSFTRFGYRVGLVECNICGEVVSFVSKCMDHAEFCIDATAAWNGRNELDQLRQRVAEADALTETFKGDGEVAWLACAEFRERAEQAEAKLALAEADNARLHRILHASADSSHKCKRCGLPYTPLEGASEDCPDCGYDGIDAIDASGEST